MIAIPSAFSPEDYLALERDNTVRHEYRRGLVYAMAGGSDDHSRVYINFITAINLHLRYIVMKNPSNDLQKNGKMV
ncbi:MULTISPECIES: Uma2 family endonuclease [unclassified Microcoleus]|uniref:Uma2 family endonuclease n=1 Tax=unclassified Microcoleus TaxID=2642155 RepID=UPI002FD09A8C